MCFWVFLLLTASLCFLFFSLLNRTYQSIHTFNTMGVPFFGQNVLCFFFFHSFPFHFFLRSNEWDNLQGKMLSSRAFNCWTKYESLGLFPTWRSHWDTFTNTAGLLSKEIAFWTIRIRVLVRRVQYSVDNCCKFCCNCRERFI